MKCIIGHVSEHGVRADLPTWALHCKGSVAIAETDLSATFRARDISMQIYTRTVVLRIPFRLLVSITPT